MLLKVSKKGIAATWSKTTGATENALRAIMDTTDDVTRAMKFMTSNAKVGQKGFLTGDDLVNSGKELQLNQGQVFLSDLKPALSRFWNKEAKQVVNLAPKNFKMNMSEAVDDAGKVLVDSGLVSRSEKGVYKLLTESEKNARAIGGKNVVELTTKETASFKNYINTLNRTRLAPSSTGKAAVGNTIRLKGKLESVGQTVSGELSGEASAILAQARSGFSNNIAQTFQKASPEMSKAYTGLNASFSKMKGSVNALEKFIKGEEAGGELFAKQFLAKAGTKRALQGDVASISTILTSEGKGALGNIVDLENAMQFSSFIPKINMGRIATASVLGIKVNPFIAAPLLTQASPKLVYHQLQVFNAGKNFLGTLTQGATKNLVESPEAMANFIRIISSVNPDIEQGTNLLLQQGGITPPQQPGQSGNENVR